MEKQWGKANDLIGIFLLALLVRLLTGYFVGTHLDDAGWFPYGIYNVFDEQAVAIVTGTSSWFWIDPSQTNAATYPPGYPLWLAVIYSVSGDRSPHAVQFVQVLLDSASVLLIAAIGKTVFTRRAGFAAGVLAAVSPLLALYGAAPLADAPTSWLVLAAVVIVLRAVRKDSVWQAVAAGTLIGMSCWFRSNGLLLSLFIGASVFFCMRSPISRRLLIAGAIVAAAIIVVSPIVVRNSIVFGRFVPTGLGAGTNLWEGIGETDRADEFGAVYGDRQLLETERSEMGRPGDESVTLYWPDGVRRDSERAQKAMAVIRAHPVWYAGIMARRMWGLLKYTGEDSGIYGSTGVNVTSVKCLPPSWRVLPLNVIATLVGYLQSVLRYMLLPLMIVGIWLAARRNWRLSLPLFAIVLYYLVVGTSLHSEIRYSLPMQAILLVFAGVGMIWVIDEVRSRSFGINEHGN